MLHCRNALGLATTVAYAPMRRLRQRTPPGPFNFVSTNRYDLDGRLVEMDRQTGDALNPWQTKTFTYTVTGAKTADINPLGNATIYQYDQLERRLTVTDAENNTNRYVYDAAGRIFQVIDAEGNVSEERRYTGNGFQQSVKDANGNVTRYEYYGFDRRIMKVFPDTSYEQYAYDPADHLIQKRTRSGQIINYGHDSLNRLRTKFFSGGSNLFTYELSGRLIDAQDTNGTFHHIYDSAGRLVSITYPGNKTVSYIYDAAGNRVRLTYPDGYFVTHVFDVLNRLTDVFAGGTNLLAHYSYDALGRRLNAGYGNGTFAAYSHLLDDRVRNLTNHFNGSGVQFTYEYDRAGHRTSLSVSDDNFLFKPSASGQTTYTPNNLNQYSLVNGTTFTYNMSGNLTSDGVNTYTYDAENRLTAATTPLHTNTYNYDLFGSRIA